MKPIKKKLRKTDNFNISHNTKADIETLMVFCNMLADKINELNDELSRTKEELKKEIEIGVELL